MWEREGVESVPEVEVSPRERAVGMKLLKEDREG